MNANGESRRIQNFVFAAILILLFLVVCRLFAPFFTALLWSILFYILLTPVHHRLIGPLDRDSLRGKILRNIWAVLLSLGVVILILLPLFLAGLQLFHQVTDLIRMVRNYLGSHNMEYDRNLENISRFIAELTSDQIVISAEDLRSRIMTLLSAGLQNLLQLSSNVARNVGSFFAGMVFMVFSLFFFFVDGSYLSRLALRVVPIRKEYLKALVTKFKDIIRNLVLGYLMVAFVQGVLAFIIFSIFRITGALVFATLTFFCAFVPILGAGIIWFPLGALRILNGNLAGGILFMVISGIFISTLDNFLRPIFLRDRIQLHPLIIFFAILGGIIVFGFNGIIMGPMAVILFLTVLDLFLMEHKFDDA